MSETIPENVKRLHLLGVGGTGMGAFASLLQQAGHTVTGSDENLYPPMSEMLERWGIEALSPYAPENLNRARPDLVIVGNVIRRDNPEATAVRERGLPQLSFPAALGALFLESRHAVVVAGTHGKTTTSSMVAHLLEAAGRDPSFLVGGVLGNFGTSARLGTGEEFVVEGDEYDTAYFDKGPKFLHYRPRTLLFTSCEFDHADIYRDTAHYESAFERLMEILPPEGLVLACASTEAPSRIAKRAKCRVETYGVGEGVEADWTAEIVEVTGEGTRFLVRKGGEALFEAHLPMGGRHNVENALGALAVCLSRGASPQRLVEGLGNFRGVRRRQELRGEPGGIRVIDDFAHHPTAVEETVAAIRAIHPGRRLLAAFEPRSNTSRRSIHQEAYGRSFDGADRVLIQAPLPHDRVPEDERLDAGALCEALRLRGIDATAHEDADAVLAALVASAREGDVILVMSNGAFGGLIDRLLQALA